jgi:hypothetical protein
MTTYDSASHDLIEAVDRVAGDWLARIATQVCRRHFGDVPTELANAIDVAAREGHAWIVGQLRDVLGADVDAQTGNPLQILRRAVSFPTAILQEAGIPAAVREEFDVSINPDDVYGLFPAHWSDIDESLTEPGIVWGAAKAATVLQRRRAEGKLDPK